MQNNISGKLNFAFLGGEPLAVPALEKLFKNGFVPKLVISNPDKPSGRKMEISSPPTALWAKAHNVTLFQPTSLRIQDALDNLKKENWDLFIVVSFGQIIPNEILDLPKYGAINIHPSLLPKYRGPSPIVTPILNGDTETGVTIIKIDEEMDHGPILAQEKISLSGNEFIQDLEKSLAELGGKLLVKILLKFTKGRIKEIPQNEQDATFCKKIKKEDGLIDLNDDAITNYNKFRAYAAWPRTFFFQNGKRIIITDAILENNSQGKQFVIRKVLPESKKEIKYEEFVKQSI